jgi:hypothetical protein
MSRTISQINKNSDTFEVWVDKTNELLNSLATEIITANDGTANTGTVAQPRKAQLLGRFGANTLVATNNLRGGNVGENGSALLTITSNTFIGGNSTVNASFINCHANAWFDNANTQVNAQIVTITGNSYIKGNTSVVAITVLGNTTVTNTIITGTDLFVTTTNTSVNSITIVTGNTFIKANSTITLLQMRGNGTTANTIMGGNLVQITANVDVTGTNHTVAGNVNFDTGTLFVDAAGNKVGIGNSTPTSILHVTGNTSISNALAVVGNVVFSNTLAVTGNVTFSNTLAVVGNVSFSNVLNVTGNSFLTGIVSYGNSESYFVDHALRTFSNSNLGSNISTPVNIFTFNKTAYSSAKMTVQVKGTTGNTQTSEVVLAHNGTDSYITVFATVASPATEDLGDFSTAINGTDVELKLKQNYVSSATKVIATLIK